MEKKLKDIHIGQIIDERIHSLGLSYAHVARELNVDRTTMYSIIKQKSIDVERLVRLSNILSCDFFEHYKHFVGNIIDHNISIDEMKRILELGNAKNITINIKVYN